MSVIPVTNNQYPSCDYDCMKNNAIRFVNANDREVSKMTSRTYNALYRENDKNFNKTANRVLNSVPLIAVAAGLVSKKGMKSSLIDGAGWGIALLAPKAVSKLNNEAAGVSPKLKKAERKHPAATLAGEVTASVAAFFGANALFNKVIAEPKVRKAANNVAETIQKTLGNVKNPIQLTPEASKGIANIKSKIGVPKFAKSAAEKIKNSETVSNIAQKASKYGKKLVKNAPIVAVLGTAAAVVGQSLSAGHKHSEIKSDIKRSQLAAARNIIQSYDTENRMLREKFQAEEKVDEPIL